MEVREAIKVLSMAVERCKSGDFVSRALHASEEIEACTAISLYIGETLMLEMEAEELLAKISKPGAQRRSMPLMLGDILTAYGDISVASIKDGVKTVAPQSRKP